MRIRATIAAIEMELRGAGTQARAVGEKSYLKSDLDFLGTAVPQIRRQAKSWLRAHPSLDSEQLRRLVRALWRRRIHESRSFGIELLVARLDLLRAEDMDLTEWILGRANTWAHVDPMSIQVVGPLVEMYPGLEATLSRWAADESFWLRRSVLLAHLLPLRRGEGEWDRFISYADQMLEEKEFFIRKAIGWVLREAGKSTPQRVIDFLSTHLDRISGLSLREAVKPLSSEDRDALLEAYRNR